MLAISKEIRTSPVAKAYDLSAATYGSYADGDTSDLFRFSGPHAYADHQVWTCIMARLSEIRLSGTISLSVLDAGCGPGTWLKRLVIAAKEMGFVEISARGFDVSAEQIQQARVNCRGLSSLPGVRLEFMVGDLTHSLPEADNSVDLTLCLYSVLSHIPLAELPSVARELGRVTRGSFITTVRPVGSMASGLVAAISDVRRLRHDQRRNWCEVELATGAARRLASTCSRPMSWIPSSRASSRSRRSKDWISFMGVSQPTPGGTPLAKTFPRRWHWSLPKWRSTSQPAPNTTITPINCC